MSSIAYITDHRMIEYHRLNGNQTIIFWRPTSQKKFTDFQEGEYLFFLAKGSEKGKQKEKGIIGYGRYTKEYVLSFHDMWKKFKTLCGYRNKEQLYEAIMRVAKNQTLPEKIHCLRLENIIFFQTPIYLSELNIHISKQVESYIYLDQEDIFVSSEIIKKASTFGQDVWSSMVLAYDNLFYYDSEIICIQNLHQKLDKDLYTEYEKQKIIAFIKQYQKGKDIRFLAGGKDDFVTLEKNAITFYIPCLVGLLSFKKNLPNIIGRYQLYYGALQYMKSNASLYLLFDQAIDQQFKALLTAANIKYIEHK